MTDFQNITDWVFDLDNTLYPRSCDLFSQIDKLMTQYVIELTGLEFDAARMMQKELYRDHGTTMSGLMLRYDIDPDDYLRCVHDIDYSMVAPHPELISLIEALPGRKFVFTNADNGHAEAVLSRLGGLTTFDGMFDIRAAGYAPKPQRSAYEKCLAEFDIKPRQAIMFDDLAKNLMVPHEMGMRTVHITHSSEIKPDEIDAWQFTGAQQATHLDHSTDDLPGFLRMVQENIA